jgi:hypothetical protein
MQNKKRREPIKVFSCGECEKCFLVDGKTEILNPHARHDLTWPEPGPSVCDRCFSKYYLQTGSRQYDDGSD